ncbi:hypothetical protein LCGC14_1292390 [marine sediment metagenome]|uniref:Uncharacterized protein n=1 Tax=marine sediment metagenome TaxID=412755 RepID=A0A0F9N8I7_9ZZZZ
MKKIKVSYDWYENIISQIDKNICPFCNSNKLILTDTNSNTFYPRKGCLSCNKWLELPKLKRDK